MANIQVLPRKTGKVYRVQFMRNGRRISQVFPKRKEAEAFLARLTVSDDLADALTNASLATITLSQTIRDYLDQYTGRDKSALHRLNWWSERLGDKPMGKIQRQHVKAALEYLAKEQKAPATLNRYKAALSAIFEWFNDEHDTKHNPAREVRQRAENNARTRFLSDDELSRLLTAATASQWPRLHLLIHLAITSGARRSELIGLRWSDIDFQRKTAHLHHTKNGDQRTLALTAAVIEELMSFRGVGDTHVFPNPGRLHDQPFADFDHHWYCALSTAEISNFRFHDLRHTCASLLAKNGATLLEIADVLGHKTLQMVKRYSHLCTGHKSALTERVFGNVVAAAR